MYVVATPIGNLEDLGFRARAVLSSVDLILAEDTRHSKKLLAHYDINNAVQALHAHNEHAMLDRLLRQLGSGKSVAMISDAGTPLISDPGLVLVKGAHDAGMPVRAVPGPSALTAALSTAAMPVGSFCFEGFLPSRQAARRKAMEALATERRTMVFFEAPHRMLAFAADAADIFGAGREVAVVKETSKINETIWRGKLGDLRQWLGKDDMARGEFVALLAGAPEASRDIGDALRVMRIISGKLPPREAAALAARITGCSSRELYEAAVKAADSE